MSLGSLGYSSLFNHDFICISETYFDSPVLEGDRSFQLNGYNLIRADHPSNINEEVFVSIAKSLYVPIK